MPRSSRRSAVPVPLPTPKKMGLTTLPAETLQLILLSLPDLPTLLSLALSCRTLYKAFRASESQLIDAILRRQIPQSVLQTALAAHAASRIRFHSAETSREFFHSYLRDSASKSPLVPPSHFRDAIGLSKLHFYVRSFARGFASRALARAPCAQNGQADETDRRVSEREVERFERALYRFQMYTYLYRKKQNNERHSVEEQVDTFFCAFSGVENEQLVVVYELLVGVIKPAFNDLSNHDVLWGAHGIGPTTDSSCEFVQAILARGLPALHRLTRAKTYEQRVQALYSSYPHYFTKFLYNGYNAYMRSSSVLDLAQRTPSVLHVENDSGPEEAWRWARKSVVMTEEKEDAHWGDLSTVRSWGYVFWDHERLSQWRVLDHDFIIPSEPADESWEATCQEAERRGSIARRCEIHVAGGSGWWSADDESKIVWKAGKPSPYDGPSERSQCQICCREVRCAPHRLVLKLPAAKSPGVDEGYFTDLEFKSLTDTISTPLGSDDHHDFRLSHMPGSPKDFRLSRLAPQFSSSTYLTPSSPTDEESCTGARPRLSRMVTQHSHSTYGRQTSIIEEEKIADPSLRLSRFDSRRGS